jgi:methionine-rich copper-binding protein CopC
MPNSSERNRAWVPPKVITLNFSEELQEEGSGELCDDAGTRVDIDGFVIDRQQCQRARLNVERLGLGEFSVHWWAKTADGDETQWRFLFD